MAKTISGTYTTSGILLATGDGPVTVTSSGYIDAPSGGTSSGNGLLGATYFGWDVTNAGTIKANRSGIDLKGPATVTNQSGGYIEGYNNGVIIRVAAGTVTNAGTVIASGTSGSSGVYLKYGGTVSNTDTTAVISGYLGVNIGGGGPGDTGTVTNMGTITGKYVFGVGLRYGGTVVNGSPTDTSAYIYGAAFGVLAANGAATITNYGTIASALCGCFQYGGIALGQGGNVTNAANATISGYVYGIGVGSGPRYGVVTIANAGTIDNAGTIIGDFFGIYVGTYVSGVTIINSGSIGSTGPSGLAIWLNGTDDVLVVTPDASFGGGVQAQASDVLVLAPGTTAGTLGNVGTDFTGFGTITIEASATWDITGSFGGVLVNSGTLQSDTGLSLYGTVINAASLEAPFYLQSGGYLTNQSSGTIAGNGTFAALTAAGATVVNDGQIINASTSAQSFAAYLQSGGTFTNHGTVSGGSGVGAQSDATTIHNSGLIEGTGDGGYGVVLQSRGTVTNSGTIEATGSLSQGVVLKYGGYVSNASGGTIVGGARGVYIGGAVTGTNTVDATLVNAGFIEATDPTNGFGVILAGASSNTLTNYGSITGVTTAVELLQHGILTNKSSGTSHGYLAGYSAGIEALTAAAITNLATIKGTGTASTGVVLFGGTLINGAGTVTSALIQGGRYGVFGVGRTLTNFGTIIGDTGIQFFPGGGGISLTNVGTIDGIGGTALQFSDGDDRLILDPGADFIGQVDGGAGANVFELAGTAAATLNGFGTQFVNFSSLLVDASARWDISGGTTIDASITFTNDGTVAVANSDTLTVNGSVSADTSQKGIFAVAAGATLALQSTIAASQTVSLGGHAALISLGDPIDFAGTIAHMRIGETIELPTISNVTSVDLLAGNVLSVNLSSGGPIPIQLAQNEDFTGLRFIPTAIPGGGTFITEIACFCRGTRIQTPEGEVRVEDLREGDLVLTHSGAAQPIKWIGYRRIVLSGDRDRDRARPIRVRRGAFAKGAPRRDLYLSPDHAVFIDGVLVPVKLLANGATILPDENAHAAEYFHIELDRHDVLLAEGLTVESYLDTGNRAMFANAGTALILHPEFAVHAGLRSWAEHACAALTVAPASVEPFWQRLADRARALGFAVEAPEITREPELRLVAGGRTLAPAAVRDDCFTFLLPPGVDMVRLGSRAERPADLRPWVDDTRRLGVMIGRVRFRAAAGALDLPLDHPALAEGWWAVERGRDRLWRWTNGDAALPVPEGAFLLEVEVTARTDYRCDPTDEAQGFAAEASAGAVSFLAANCRRRLSTSARSAAIS